MEGLVPFGADFSALWLLTAMSAIVLALSPMPLPLRLLAIAAGGGAALVLRPPVSWAGVLAAVTLFCQLLWPARTWVRASAPAMAGALTIIWGRLAAAQGAPLLLATAVVVAAVVGVTLLQARRPNFAPDPLCEEARLVVFALAVTGVMLPEMADGWRTAAALNVSPSAPVTPIPPWVTVSVSLCVLGGGVFSWWGLRR